MAGASWLVSKPKNTSTSRAKDLNDYKALRVIAKKSPLISGFGAAALGIADEVLLASKTASRWAKDQRTDMFQPGATPYKKEKRLRHIILGGITKRVPGEGTWLGRFGKSIAEKAIDWREMGSDPVSRGDVANNALGRKLRGDLVAKGDISIKNFVKAAKGFVEQSRHGK